MSKMPIKLIMVSMVVISVALFYKSSAMALAIPSYQSRDSLLPDFMDAEPALGLEDNNIDANPRPETLPNGQKPWVKIAEHPPNSIIRSNGTPIELECTADGSPSPYIRWYRDYKPIIEDGLDNNYIIEGAPGMSKTISRLIINNILPNRKHVFSCVAVAGLKKDVYHTYVQGKLPQLSDLSEYLLINSEIMKSPLKPRITYFYSVIFQEIATTLVLPCKIVGNPKPEFQWLDYDNNTIIEDSRIKILESGELIIEGLEWTDMGTYTCEARNPIAKDSITTFVYPVLKGKK